MGIKMDKPPKEISLRELSILSTIELARYRRKEPSNDKYCLEIFRRAVVERNHDAWPFCNSSLMKMCGSGLVVIPIKSPRCATKMSRVTLMIPLRVSGVL